MSYDTHESLGSIGNAIDYAESLLESEKNYNSHEWIGQRTGGNDGGSNPPEWVRFCSRCRIEDLGDPTEFDTLKYPHCDEVVGPSPDLTINLKYVQFEVWCSEKCVASTLLSSGHTCVGSRPDTQENREEAERQGYTPDEKGIWRSLVEHEFLHSLVAEVMFDQPSRVVLAESGAEITPTWERYEEEAVVLSIQRLFNTGIITSTLDRVLCIRDSLISYGPKIESGWITILDNRWNEEILPLLEKVYQL